MQWLKQMIHEIQSVAKLLMVDHMHVIRPPYHSLETILIDVSCTPAKFNTLEFTQCNDYLLP